MWKMKEHVLDILELDGGWLTQAGISLCMVREPNPDYLDRTIRNLVRTGKIESRPRPLTGFNEHEYRKVWE
jgi:hypothetical protein